MHKRFFNVMYVFNVVLQAFFSLCTPIAIGIFAAWFLVSKLSAPEWLYVIFIILGVGSGLVGMVRFVISSMAGIERLEQEQERERKERRKKEKERGSGQAGKE